MIGWPNSTDNILYCTVNVCYVRNYTVAAIFQCNKEMLSRTVPVNKELFTRSVLVNNLFQQELLMGSQTEKASTMLLHKEKILGQYYVHQSDRYIWERMFDGE